MRKLFLKPKEVEVFYCLGETILGVPRDELGDEFINEADAFIDNLDEFLQKDIRILLILFNSRITSLIFIGKLKKFTSLSQNDREKFYKKWLLSKIPLLRTGGGALKAICGWSYYSNEKSWKEINYPGKTLGREHETPTLIDKPWEPGMEVPL